MKKTSSIALVICSIFPLIMTIPLYFLGISNISFLWGELAYCLFIFDTILGLRPELIEKHIELNKMYMIHGFMAVLAVLFAFFHVEMSHIHGLTGLFGNIAFYGSILVVALALIFLTNQMLVDIPLFRQIIKLIRNVGNKLKISREINILFHSLSPLIVVCVFIHVLLIPFFSKNTGFMIFFVGYFLLFILSYIYYGIVKKLKVSRYVVKNVKIMNDSSFELTLNYSYGKKIRAHGGQYVFIQLPFCKIDEYHPFSILQYLNGGNEIKLGIKKSGDFTKQLSTVQKGTIVKIKGVYGHFIAPQGHEPILAIAGGIGVTPCISLLQSIPSQRKGYLLWSVSSPSDIIFGDEINRLKETHPNINVIYYDSSQKGHLNSKVLKDNISELQSKERIDCFICGPKPMTKSMISTLNSLGVNNDDIISEGFIF